MKKILKGIRKKEQGNKFVTKGIKVLGDSDTKDLNCSLALGGTLVEPTNEVELSETACRMAERLGRGGNPLQNDATTCPPLEGGPKSLISRRCKNVVNCNQEPSPEFVSSPQLTNKFYPQLLHTDSLVSPQLNGSLCITAREGKEKRNKLINLSTYRLIDFKKVAFTLAEVLITLGIIGIVAAMTIPTLITNYQKKQTVTKLQKAISVINQAYKLSFDDVGEPDDAFSIGSENYFKQYWAPYIKVQTYCSTPQVCGYSSNTPFKTLNNALANFTLVAANKRTTFYTMDGFLFVILTASGSLVNPEGNRSNHVFVDINGSTGPNKIGRDVFLLLRVEDGKGVQPFGYQYSSNEVNNLCVNNADIWSNACAEKIRRAGWEIDKSYPWK